MLTVMYDALCGYYTCTLTVDAVRDDAELSLARSMSSLDLDGPITVTRSRIYRPIHPDLVYSFTVKETLALQVDRTAGSFSFIFKVYRAGAEETVNQTMKRVFTAIRNGLAFSDRQFRDYL